MTTLSAMTQQQLEARLTRLARIRSNALVQLVLCLAEVFRRRLHLAAGEGSLSAYCCTVLKEERRKAWRLAMAAEAVAVYPLAAQLLESRALSVSALIAVKKALTAENHEQLLNGAIGLTEDEAAAFASRFAPMPRRHDSVRVVHFIEASPAPSSEVGPTLELVERRELRAILTAETAEQLEQVKAALSHSIPDGNLNDVLAECFRLTLEACERRKLGRVVRSARAEHASSSPESSSPRRARRADAARPEQAEPPAPLGPSDDEDERSRHIPAAVRQAVWVRDDGRCSFTSAEGHRCNSTYQLEFDHWWAFGLGGEHSVDNVRVLCASHNRYEAERLFGRAFMSRYFGGTRRRGAA